jgi:hypothetical protein
VQAHQHRRPARVQPLVDDLINPPVIGIEDRLSPCLRGFARQSLIAGDRGGLADPGAAQLEILGCRFYFLPIGLSCALGGQWHRSEISFPIEDGYRSAFDLKSFTQPDILKWRHGLDYLNPSVSSKRFVDRPPLIMPICKPTMRRLSSKEFRLSSFTRRKAHELC